jgi:hypothetical protein
MPKDVKTLYVDDEHHRLVRFVAASLDISLREAAHRLIRGDDDAAKAARQLSAQLPSLP